MPLASTSRKLDQIPLFLLGFGVADRKHRFSGVLPELICLRHGHLSGARHPTAPASLNKAEVGRLSFRPNQPISDDFSVTSKFKQPVALPKHGTSSVSAEYRDALSHTKRAPRSLMG
jgi:hypothetical protein